MQSDTRWFTDVFSLRHDLRPQIRLDGEWEFRRDPDDAGKRRRWHEGHGAFERTICIPGAPQAQGVGEPTARQRTHFSGPFWVRRAFRLPSLKPTQRAWLRMGGILPAAEVYLNGAYLGYTQSSRTQQRVDVTDAARPGGENLIAIKVCDFPQVRLDGLWEMDEIYRTWTGVYRPVQVEITDRVSVIDAYLRPQLMSGSVGVILELSEAPSHPLSAVLHVRDGRQIIGEAAMAIPAHATKASARVQLAQFTPWSPDSPQLYALDISLRGKDSRDALDRVRIRFGMREFTVTRSKFHLNGKPIFLRCFGDDQYYPETLSPPADKAWYLPRLKRARQYGMNAAKSCVEVLSPDYIEAADEAGIMIIQEMPFGLSGLRENRHVIDESFRRYYSQELDGLVRQSRNNASVVAYSLSSELGFARQTQESFDFFNRDLPRQARDLAPHAAIIDCTGYANSEDTAKGRRVTDFYASGIDNWAREILDETPPDTDGLHPTVLHEYNWWSCYPDPTDRPKYAAAQLKPFWLDTLVETARANGQEELIPTYRRNSLWLQALCRKNGIEFARRNPLVEGFILWLLIDMAQATEGLLDDFWQPKNVSATEFAKSNGDTVIVLAREGNRCLQAGAKQRIPLAISHYGPDVLQDCVLNWKVAGGGRSLQGRLRVPALKPGKLTQAGHAEFALGQPGKARRLELQAALRRGDRTINTNEWSFWAFPEVRRDVARIAAARGVGALADDTQARLGGGRSAGIPASVSLVVTDCVDDALAKFVEAGGRCLLFTEGAEIETTVGSPGRGNFYRYFRTIPWNHGDYGNSGTVISNHPALAAFPHEEMCDLQFLSMLKGLLPMAFEPLREYGGSPIIRGIDHYAANRNNATMLEFNVGRGKVLVTSLGVLKQCAEHIEARYLLQCLLDYVRGDRFAPTAAVPREVFLRLFSRKTG